MSGAGQRFVARVDPGLRWLDGAGDQKDGVLARIVLPVDGHTSGRHKGRENIYTITMIRRKNLSQVALHFEKPEAKIIHFQHVKKYFELLAIVGTLNCP